MKGGKEGSKEGNEKIEGTTEERAFHSFSVLYTCFVKLTFFTVPIICKCTLCSSFHESLLFCPHIGGEGGG